MYGIAVILLAVITLLAFVLGGKFLADFHRRLRRATPTMRPLLRAVADLVKFARIVFPVAILATIMVAPKEQMVIPAAIAAACLLWQFTIFVLLPLYRALYFLAHGQADTWHRAWEVGKLRGLQPRDRDELLAALQNWRRTQGAMRGMR
jgi:hypothetical protein